MAASHIEEAVFAFLVADPTVSGLLVSRIYPLKIPEGATNNGPALSYQLVTAPSEHTKDGDAAFTLAHFQFSCWASKYSDAKAVIVAVRNALQGYTGPTMDGFAVSEVIVSNERDLDDPETMEFGVALDAILTNSN